MKEKTDDIRTSGYARILSADEMFEELGYVKTEDDKSIIYDDDLCLIIFYKVEKTLGFYDTEQSGEYIVGYDMQELQAINKKVKELGWYE